MIGVSQGWKLSGAIKTAERWLAEGALEHNGAPLMNWCVGNAKIVPTGNAVLVTKVASGSAKIDPLLALFNVTALMMKKNRKPRVLRSTNHAACASYRARPMLEKLKFWRKPEAQSHPPASAEGGLLAALMTRRCWNTSETGGLWHPARCCATLRRCAA